MSRLRVVDGPRQSGKTTALLQSAVNDENVIIVTPDVSRCVFMRKDLTKMLLDKENSWMSPEAARLRAEHQVIPMGGAPTYLRGRDRSKVIVKVDGLEEVLWLVFGQYVSEAVL